MSITYIVPYYNLEKDLLTRCINSIAALDNYIDWEILVIDDGTPSSKAREWIEEYNDQRIRYFLIEHSGLGGARNKGLELAKMEYVQMVDSDDYLFISQEKELIKMVKEKKPDALIFKYQKVYGKENTPNGNSTGSILYEGDATEYMSSNDTPPSCCRFIIKRESIGNLRFSENLLHEDEEFSTFMFLNLKYIIITNYTPYAYYQREDSIINSIDKENIKKRFADLATIIKRIQIATKSIASNEKQRQALERKTNILAMCFIVNLIRDAFSTQFIQQELKQLKKLELYPLPSKNYGLRYNIIRTITFKQVFVKIYSFFYRTFKKKTAPTIVSTQ